jgi:ABC-type multidrug transport system fused ATPase/permease subunit
MKALREFARLLSPYKKKVIFAFVSILAANALGLAFPWALKIIIDAVWPNRNLVLLNWLIVGLILTFILKFYFGFVCEYLINLVGENVVCDLRNKLCWHLQRLSVQYMDNIPKGQMLSSVIGDVDSIRNFLFGGAIDFAYSSLNILFILGVLFLLDWRLTAITLAFVPVFAITFYKFTPRLAQRHRLIREKYAELTSHLHEVFNGIRVVAGFAKEDYEAEKFDSKQKEIAAVAVAGHKIGIGLWMASEFVSSLGLVTLIWFGTKAVFSGRITVGTLMAFYSYLGMFFVPVIKVAVVNNHFQQAAASMERINRMLKEEPKIQERRSPVIMNAIRGDIKFDRINFSYNGGKRILSDINLDAKAREVIALVGKSGAGKTTLINLLLRFYDPQEGAIFIDGYDLKDLDLKSYRSKIAMVLQDDYLFNSSVRENILYGCLDVPENKMIEAARLANAHQFITELSDGYDTQIGERGVALSYGQRQRISIARSIVRDPSILILDEATSAVDSQTERAIITQAYKNLMRGRTTFIIAHRLSTVTLADRIIVIEAGRITEAGSHFELFKERGAYWGMWQQQTAYAADFPLMVSNGENP